MREANRTERSSLPVCVRFNPCENNSDVRVLKYVLLCIYIYVRVCAPYPVSVGILPLLLGKQTRRLPEQQSVPTEDSSAGLPDNVNFRGKDHWVYCRKQFYFK